MKKELEKIMTSGMTTGQILRALTELRIRRAKEKSCDFLGNIQTQENKTQETEYERRD